MASGYVGKILRVNLADGEASVEELDWDRALKYVGGRGYAASMLYDELRAGVDPLSPENLLIFSTGPLTGTAAPTSGRFTVSSKSPLTGTIFDSNCGGFWGPELKRAGFDVLVVEGRSPSPVYLWIHDGDVEVRPADRLAGMSTSGVEAALRGELGSGVRVASIGPAGENLVRIACIVVDGHRVAGRGGMGAVMGSKNLKAVAVRGRGRVEVANKHAFMAEVRRVLKILSRNPLTGDLLRRYGTPCLTRPVNKAGVLPTRNFQGGFFGEAERISGEAVKAITVRAEGCYACPIRCGRAVKLRAGPEAGRVVGGPEYETLWSLGAQCGISDLDAIAYANHLCNEYGVDTVSLGNAVGFLMECVEKGVISEEELGIRLRWGDSAILPELVRLTARREGVGRLLAEGVRRISELHGGGEFAMHVKGLELPAYDPRGAKGMGLAYATSNRGGCHLRAYVVMSEVLSVPRYLDPLKVDGKAELVKRLQDVYAVLDSMILCKFTSLALFDTLNYEPRFYARLLTTATGFYFDEEEFRRAGERIYNIERLFNVREGLDRSADTLPRRLLEVPMPSGPAEGHVVELGRMLDEYYRVRGWDPLGRPSDRKLMELGIIAEPRWPVLQVALDLRDLKEALRIAGGAHRGGASWLEAGTPLIKSVGMEAVRRLREFFPSATIVADLKTLDVGWMEVEMASQAGADVIGVSGLAHNNTIKDAVGCSRRYGTRIMVDLLEVKNPLERAKELEALGVDYICLHTGIDVQRDREEEIDRKVDLIRRIAEAVEIPVAAAGGIRLETAGKVVKAGAKIVIVGGAITRAANPEAAAAAILREMRKAARGW